MKKERQLTALIGTYSAILLLVSILAISFFLIRKPQREIFQERIVETENIYVFVEDTRTTTTTENKSIRFIAREYNGIIGIFSTEGKLLRTVEVYTKTLPKTDQSLLREGISLLGEDELRALIEDYSS
ncbi:MAG: hypothetical protein J6V42_04905 [Clostridia bacterium]|nr:hypothetical protein [Clostridia bacterium]